MHAQGEDVNASARAEGNQGGEYHVPLADTWLDQVVAGYKKQDNATNVPTGNQSPRDEVKRPTISASHFQFKMNRQPAPTLTSHRKQHC